MQSSCFIRTAISSRRSRAEYVPPANGLIILSMTAQGASTVVELEQRLRQLTLLQEAVRKINSTLDLDQLLSEIVVDLAQAFGCNRTCLLLLNEAGDELEILAIHGFDTVHKGDRFKPGKEGMVGQVSVTGERRF